VYVCEGVLPAIFLIAQVGFVPELYDIGMGGACFLFGILFFKSDGKLPFAHAIWHLFVFGGTFYHSVAFIALLERRKAWLI